MRHIARTFVLLGALAMAASAYAAPQTAAKPAAAKPAKKTETASHSVKGIVKSVDASSLVISRKKGGDMTFTMDSSTSKSGSPAAGSEVSVRYRQEGNTMVATAVTAQPVKQVASAKPAASKKPTK